MITERHARTDGAHVRTAPRSICEGASIGVQLTHVVMDEGGVASAFMGLSCPNAEVSGRRLHTDGSSSIYGATTRRLLAPAPAYLPHMLQTTARQQPFLFVAVLFLFSIIWGCSSQQAIEDAHARGDDAGRNDGQRDGEAAGFETGVKAAEEASYREAVNRLYSSGDFHRNAICCLVVMGSAFLLGFSLQYGLLYVLRKRGLFYDIDRIILCGRATTVDLNKPSPVPIHAQRTGSANDRTIIVPFLLAFLLSLTGCQNSERATWQKAYEASYSAAYQEGRQAGYARGKQVGDEKGAAAAEMAAGTGGAWQLYTNLALGALTLGTGAGLFAQYVVLLACRASGRLPQFSTVALVPAMKSSLAYSVFEQRRWLMVAVNEELTRLRVTHTLQLAQLETTRDYVARKVMAASSIDELSQVRFIDLAKMKVSELISASDEKARQSTNGRQSIETRLPNTHLCPHCQKRIRYKDQIANTTVQCPNKKCGQLITLPPHASN